MTSNTTKEEHEADCLEIVQGFFLPVVITLVFIVGACLKLKRHVGNVAHASGMLNLCLLVQNFLPMVMNSIKEHEMFQNYLPILICIGERIVAHHFFTYVYYVSPALLILWLCMCILNEMWVGRHVKNSDCVRVTMNKDRSRREDEIDFSFFSIAQDRPAKDIFGDGLSSQAAGRYKAQVIDQQSRRGRECLDPFVPLNSAKFEDREVFRRIRATIEGIRGHASLEYAMEPQRRRLKQKKIVLGLAYERQHDSQVNSRGNYDLFQIMAIEESQLKKIWKFRRVADYDFGNHFSGRDGMTPPWGLEAINKASRNRGLPRLNFSDPPSCHDNTSNTEPVRNIIRRQKLTRFRTMVRMAEKWFKELGEVTTTISEGVAAGASTIKLADVSGLSEGMSLTISQPEQKAKTIFSINQCLQRPGKSGYAQPEPETKTIVSINQPDLWRSCLQRLGLSDYAEYVTLSSPLEQGYPAGWLIVAKPALKAPPAISVTGAAMANTLNLNLADVSGLSAGMSLKISDGGRSETKSIVSVSPDSSRCGPGAVPGYVALDTPLEHSYRQGSSIVEKAPITISATAAGANELKLADVSEVSARMSLTISDGGNSETRTILSVRPDSSQRLCSRRRTASGNVKLDGALEHSYRQGSSIVTKADNYLRISSEGLTSVVLEEEEEESLFG